MSEESNTALARKIAVACFGIKEPDKGQLEHARILILQSQMDFSNDLTKDLEKALVQLTACGVAALGHAEGDCEDGDYGYSGSLGDVKILRAKYETSLDALKLLVGDDSNRVYEVLAAAAALGPTPEALLGELCIVTGAKPTTDKGYAR